MITVKTRKEVGFTKDTFLGYIYFKDGDPVLQLHLYNEFYTVFWRGTAKPERLWEYLCESIPDIIHFHRLAPDDLNTGNVRYLLNSTSTSLRFAIIPKPGEQTQIHESHSQFLSTNSTSITFVRYDVEGSFPVILWGGTVDSPDSEVGFSTLGLLPPAIVTLFRSSSRIGIDDFELTEISKDIDAKVRRVR